MSDDPIDTPQSPWPDCSRVSAGIVPRSLLYCAVRASKPRPRHFSLSLFYKVYHILHTLRICRRRRFASHFLKRCVHARPGRLPCALVGTYARPLINRSLYTTAGTPQHVYTSPRALGSAFTFLEDRLQESDSSEPAAAAAGAQEEGKSGEVKDEL